MPCYSPITAYRAASGRLPNGKWPLVFSLSQGFADMPVTIPCGKCIGCRLEYSKKWAIRCVHEAAMWENNIFLTLTYDDDHLPQGDDGPTLVKRDFQLFMKRLRKKYGKGIRFYGCGEYGEKYQRPHYHVIIFNLLLSDLVLVRNGKYPLYKDSSIGRLWINGFHSIGEVNFETSAYVARYILKKHDKKDYGKREKEFVLMSRRPGIGLEWLKKNKDDVYPFDAVFMQREGKLIKMKPPRYYDNKFESFDDKSFQTIMKVKRRRLTFRERNPIKVSELDQKEKFQKLKLERKVRTYETNV